MTEGKRKLEWCKVRKYFRFFVLFIPRSSNCKKPFRGFLEILIYTISYEFTSFSIFHPPKTFAQKYIISFNGIHYWLRSIKKICACAQRIFWFLVFGFCALLERGVHEIKNSKSKIKIPSCTYTDWIDVAIFCY